MSWSTEWRHSNSPLRGLGLAVSWSSSNDIPLDHQSQSIRNLTLPHKLADFHPFRRRTSWSIELLHNNIPLPALAMATVWWGLEAVWERVLVGYIPDYWGLQPASRIDQIGRTLFDPRWHCNMSMIEESVQHSILPLGLVSATESLVLEAESVQESAAYIPVHPDHRQSTNTQQIPCTSTPRQFLCRMTKFEVNCQRNIQSDRR